MEGGVKVQKEDDLTKSRVLDYILASFSGHPSPDLLTVPVESDVVLYQMFEQHGVCLLC